MLYYNEQTAVLSGNSSKLQDISIKEVQELKGSKSLNFGYPWTFNFSQIKYCYACIVMFYFISWTQETNLKTI